MRRNTQLAEIERRAGIVFPGALDFLPREQVKDVGGNFKEWGGIALDMALDAQPTLVTGPNAGIPSFLTTYLDPKVIDVLVTPNNAVKIYGEVRKGSWVDKTAMFPMREFTGETSSYDDYSENGRAGANVQWEWRQSYLFQTFTEWGELELDTMGAGRIDWAASLNISSALILDKFQNQSYFYGISGLQNYGGLNDPSLSAALTPATKAATGTSWKNATPTEMLADFQALWVQLQTQTGSNLEMDAPLVLGLHSISETYLYNTNQFGLNGYEMIKKVFPNLRVQQAPQYLSGTTYSCQLIVENIDGQRTVDCGFNEKMRAHRVVMASSSFKQKKTAGTWGAIIYRPIGIASMAGI